MATKPTKIDPWWISDNKTALCYICDDIFISKGWWFETVCKKCEPKLDQMVKDYYEEVKARYESP